MRSTTFAQVLLGLVTGVVFLLIAHALAPRRAQAVLSVGLVGAAMVYGGFALYWSAPPTWLALELAGLALYSAIAWGAWRRAYNASRLLALGWIAHPLWDLGLHWSGMGAEYAPHWYVVACPSFDLLVALYLFVRREPNPVSPTL